MSKDPRTRRRLRFLADPTFHRVLSLLENAERGLHVDELAEILVDHDIAIVGTEEYEDRLERARISLHHDWLPHLVEAGLVEYDREANTASIRDPETPLAESFDASNVIELVDYVHSRPAAEGTRIEVIEGRDSVIEYGRRLADEAAEELFVMYVSTDLLEDECVRRAQAAIDRGASMYAGSQNPDVRELTRTRLPEATLWEPQLDWMNSPTYPRVGRLVLVDRRSVMLAVLEEPRPDGSYPREIALAGEGEDHPLVVLVRELLGPRLDHLDYQSRDFRNEQTT